ncbi:MAG: hypothetical protein ACOX4V_02945 [Anaerovoracaceae bacterium]
MFTPAHGLEAEPCGARVKRRCGVMTSAPAETGNVPIVRDAWQMWRKRTSNSRELRPVTVSNNRSSSRCSFLFKVRYHALAVSAASAFM